MTWETLRAVQLATQLEFAPWLARKHTFVRLTSGRWTRVLGLPDARYCSHVRGREWTIQGEVAL